LRGEKIRWRSRLNRLKLIGGKKKLMKKTRGARGGGGNGEEKGRFFLRIQKKKRGEKEMAGDTEDLESGMIAWEWLQNTFSKAVCLTII